VPRAVVRDRSGLGGPIAPAIKIAAYSRISTEPDLPGRRLSGSERTVPEP
jgi:hypothetical protein